MAHTKGPWIYSYTAKENATIRDTHEGNNIATVKNRADGPRNAKLISAAPELLEALQNLLEAIEASSNTKHGDFVYERTVAHKAIEKATK